ncbi:Detected protein of confused Function [Hibiscus syriacus]|uniref:3-hydroxyisobutyryl-CoA hydrolase n=1 Tax=Hibiscus syriacus TaxID=106335 RepID=A0A6A3C862_HIBSY|nr:Detected protein of confused Function [Hibiscus syriacus]
MLVPRSGKMEATVVKLTTFQKKLENSRSFTKKLISYIISLHVALQTHFVPSAENEAVDGSDGWISTTIQTLKKASPTSLKISLRSSRVGRLQGVGPCLVREYRMTCHFLRREFSKDFFEVPAVSNLCILARFVSHHFFNQLKSMWEPTKLELITGTQVDNYFSKMKNEDWEDLKLPAGSKFTYNGQ